MKHTLKPYSKIILSFSCFIFIGLSCNKLVYEEASSLLTQAATQNIAVFSALPVNLNPYNLLPAKNVQNSNNPFYLDSLLVWEYEEQLYFQGSRTVYRQVPLKFSAGTVLCSITKSLSRETAADSTTTAKSYYIIVERLSEGIKEEYVVTLFPKYASTNFNNECNYLKKGNYSGLIIFSDKQGNFKKIEHYRNGLILEGKMLDPEQVNKRSGITYLAVYVAPRTRSGDDDWWEHLPPIVVIPTDDTKNPSEKPNEGGGITAPGDNNGFRENGSGGSPPGNNNDPTEDLTCRVILTSSHHDRGYVTGSGTYAAKSNVSIAATPHWGHKFNIWSGDIPSSSAALSIQIERDIFATAQFSEKSLCIDLFQNKATPLRGMRLAPPSSYNIPGATYGMTRRDDYGKAKKHNGIDLHAPVGTPVYAMFSGTIGKCITEQPNKIAVIINGEKTMVYPANYRGDNNKAGNRLYINSQIGSDNISIGYCHLKGDGNGPVAMNPRTGNPFQTGDTVYQEEVVGYTGYTGNASQNVSHLHLNMAKNGQSINPTQYLNANISTSTIEIVTPFCR